MHEDIPAAVLARALAYLKQALPLADRLTMDEAAMERVARHALSVRARMPWGPSIPEDVFLAYTLFPRVNNENPAFYHQAIWEALAPRLEGLDMTSAAQEVNRWCFEQATYQSTDGRTANALTVMRRGFGRCGEESVLLVSALRACGIPARQLYAPLWSHCDDNHAWVEAWVDGEWHYMGACEPELSLDSGWFTAAASKAMLIHTRAYGLLPEGERAETRAGTAWVVNRTAAYARTALLKVTVTENGAPVPGLRVEFQLANMAAFGPICVKTTDEAGRAELLCGLGTLRLWVTDGERCLEADADVAACGECALDFGLARPIVPRERRFDQRPPLESRIQPADFPAERVEAHEGWLAAAEAARQARFAVPGDLDPLVASARGNRRVIEDFLADGRFDGEDARALLGSLSEKDLADVTPEVLVDALEGALPWKDRYPRQVWVQAVLCPRAENEMLYPVRRWLRENLPAFGDGEAVWRYLQEKLTLCEMEPVSLIPDLRSVPGHGACSRLTRDILFVALCRANGIAARLDPVTGERTAWRDGAFRPLSEGAARGKLRLVNGAGRTLTGGVDFSVALLREGAFRPLELYGVALESEMALELPAGPCRVTVVSRQIDGSVEGITLDVALPEGGEERATLTPREDHTADKLLRAELEPLSALDGGEAAVLPDALAGRPAIAALVAPGQEPTEHFFNELLESRDALAERGVAVRLLVEDGRGLDNEKLAAVLAGLSDARCLTRPDAQAVLQWRRAMNAGELRLPLAVALDEAGRGLFAFVNYNVGSVQTLLRVLDAR